MNGKTGTSENHHKGTGTRQPLKQLSQPIKLISINATELTQSHHKAVS